MTRRCRRVQGLRLERCQPGGKSDEKKANQRIAHFCQFLFGTNIVGYKSARKN